MLDIRLLGPVEVWADGRRAPLGGTRPLAVLSALVVHLGEVLSTERLVDCVWDDEAPATAGALVATHVSVVRRALATVGEAGVIRTRPPGYVAALPPSGIDARRFEELLASGRATAGRGRPEEAAELLSEALGLWRGREALEGLGQSFARIEAARLTELRLTGQEDHVDLLLALGHADRTIAPLLTQVADHPLRERPRAQLMTALFRTGRVSDALLTYQEAREVLREELGVDPGPELRALHRAVLTNDPALLGPAPRTAARPPAASPEAAGHAGTGPVRAPRFRIPPGPRLPSPSPPISRPTSPTSSAAPRRSHGPRRCWARWPTAGAPPRRSESSPGAPAAARPPSPCTSATAPPVSSRTVCSSWTCGPPTPPRCGPPTRSPGCCAPWAPPRRPCPPPWRN
ncbi:AfsR-like regulatory protein [Streptomyces griseoaurantiacus M045]|uniref:AfsR-like regulatory protein n=1 Tax=Streptomyces griseoaurantiacus M045 TaxID=996637 RepID=F3NJU0_9ACTN|nr:AfsR-like regulatory protein [Streptomyces griseoaurantiacus M045]